MWNGQKFSTSLNMFDISNVYFNLNSRLEFRHQLNKLLFTAEASEGMSRELPSSPFPYRSRLKIQPRDLEERCKLTQVGAYLRQNSNSSCNSFVDFSNNRM